MYKYPEYNPELFEHGIGQYGDRPSPLGHFQQLYRDADEFGDDFDYEALHSQLGYDEKTKIPKKIRNNAPSYKYITQSPVFQKMAENFDEEAYERMDGSNRAYERYLQEILPMTEENFENKDMYDKYMNYLNSDEIKPLQEWLKETIEDTIESNPEQAAASLPEGSDIQKEAEQAIDGGKDAEVRNDVVEEAIKKEPGAFLDNDFFANYANKMLGGNGVTEDTLKPTGSIYSTPKIDRADHSGYRNGKVSKEDYKKQLEKQLDQSNTALSKASQMMHDERDRVEAEGGQFNRGHVGAYAFPAGSAKAIAEKKLAELDTDEFTDADAKYYANNATFDDLADDLTYGEDYTRETADSIDWDKVKEYAPGEDPYYKVDDFDPNAPDYVPNDSADVWTHKDEDFAGPDELPATIEQIMRDDDPNYRPDGADEDFAGPDELPATIPNEGLPAEQNVYDTSEYNFDWAYEMLPDEVKEEFANIPDEEKEDWLKLHFPEFSIGGGGPISAPHGSINPGDEIRLNKLGRAGSSFGRMFNDIPSSSSAVSGAAVNGSGTVRNDRVQMQHGASGHADAINTPNEASAARIGSKQGNENNGNLTSNGASYNSGAVSHSGSSLKVQATSLPNGEAHTQDYDNSDLEGGAIDLKDAHLENLEARIRSIPQGLAEQLGFGTKYKHVTYKGLNISECGPGEIQEIEKILSMLGV